MGQRDSTEPYSAPQPRGHVDVIEGMEIAGWVWDAAHPELSLSVDLEIEGSVVAKTVANR